MADTVFTANLLVSTWGRELFREAEDFIYFKRFMGTSENSIIQVKNELNGKEGQDVTFGLIMKLGGAGVTGDATLEGNEEAITTYSMIVEIDQVRNACRSRGRLHDRSHYYDFRTNAKNLLKIWLAELVDQDIFNTLTANPTRALGEDAAGTYRFDATYKNALAAGDVTTTKGIDILWKLAQEPYNPGELVMRTINVDGVGHYVLILSGEAMYDLKQDATWAQGHREARERGKENPIFRGSDYLWSGVVVHQHKNITTFIDGGGAAVRGSLNLFLGAQAGVYAKADEPIWVEKRFDYDNKTGVAGGIIYGFEKSVFASGVAAANEDFATMIYCTSNTKLAA